LRIGLSGVKCWLPHYINWQMVTLLILHLSPKFSYIMTFVPHAGSRGMFIDIGNWSTTVIR